MIIKYLDTEHYVSNRLASTAQMAFAMWWDAYWLSELVCFSKVAFCNMDLKYQEEEDGRSLRQSSQDESATQILPDINTSLQTDSDVAMTTASPRRWWKNPYFWHSLKEAHCVVFFQIEDDFDIRIIDISLPCLVMGPNGDGNHVGANTLPAGLNGTTTTSTNNVHTGHHHQHRNGRNNNGEKSKTTAQSQTRGRQVTWSDVMFARLRSQVMSGNREHRKQAVDFLASRLVHPVAWLDGSRLKHWKVLLHALPMHDQKREAATKCPTGLSSAGFMKIITNRWKLLCFIRDSTQCDSERLFYSRYTCICTRDPPCSDKYQCVKQLCVQIHAYLDQEPDLFASEAAPDKVSGFGTNGRARTFPLYKSPAHANDIMGQACVSILTCMDERMHSVLAFCEAIFSLYKTFVYGWTETEFRSMFQFNMVPLCLIPVGSTTTTTVGQTDRGHQQTPTHAMSDYSDGDNSPTSAPDEPPQDAEERAYVARSSSPWTEQEARNYRRHQRKNCAFFRMRQKPRELFEVPAAQMAHIDLSWVVYNSVSNGTIVLDYSRMFLWTFSQTFERMQRTLRNANIVRLRHACKHINSSGASRYGAHKYASLDASMKRAIHQQACCLTDSLAEQFGHWLSTCAHPLSLYDMQNPGSGGGAGGLRRSKTNRLGSNALAGTKNALRTTSSLQAASSSAAVAQTVEFTSSLFYNEYQQLVAFVQRRLTLEELSALLMPSGKKDEKPSWFGPRSIQMYPPCVRQMVERLSDTGPHTHLKHEGRYFFISFLHDAGMHFVHIASIYQATFMRHPEIERASLQQFLQSTEYGKQFVGTCKKITSYSKPKVGVGCCRAITLGLCPVAPVGGEISDNYGAGNLGRQMPKGARTHPRDFYREPGTLWDALPDLENFVLDSSCACERGSAHSLKKLGCMNQFSQEVIASGFPLRRRSIPISPPPTTTTTLILGKDDTLLSSPSPPPEEQQQLLSDVVQMVYTPPRYCWRAPSQFTREYYRLIRSLS